MSTSDSGRTRDRDRPRLVPDAVEAYVNGPRRQQRPGFLGPLDDRDAVAVDHLFEPEVCELGHGGRAVGVDVMDGEATAILVDEDEGRACRARRDPEPVREALDEARLARAQLADEPDDVARAERPSQTLAGRRGLFGTLAGDRRGRGHARGTARLANASASAVITSLAINASSPTRAAATSPASP